MEKNVVDITTIEHVKELPREKLRGYMLGKDYTEKEAARDYKAVYGKDPVRGWKWMNYLYLQITNEFPAPSFHEVSESAHRKSAGAQTSPPAPLQEKEEEVME